MGPFVSEARKLELKNWRMLSSAKIFISRSLTDDVVGVKDWFQFFMRLVPSFHCYWKYRAMRLLKMDFCTICEHIILIDSA